MTQNISNTYQLQKNKFAKALSELKKKDDFIVLTRAVIFLSAIGLLIYGYYFEKPFLKFLAIPFMLVFLWLIIKHSKVRAKIKYLQRLILINTNCLLRLSGKWTTFHNSGQQFINPKHKYSWDLNIFGQGSLFQYINATTTFMGEQSLAKLLNQSTSIEKIQLRQQAILDLASRLDWRQHFQATGLDTQDHKQNPENLVAWSKSRRTLTNNKLHLLLWLLPALTAIFIILAYFQMVSPLGAILLLSIQLLTVLFTEKIIVRPAFDKIWQALSDLERFSLLLKCIEEQNFDAELLIKMQKKLFIGSKPASKQIRELSKIADRISLRFNPLVHFVVNILTFWDLAALIKLEKWKDASGISLRNWFEVIGDFETLSSFAGLAYDNPDWVYPEIADGSPLLEAEDLGHPLIIEDLRVCNDASLPVPGTTFIITGSNMSGKSTFLRTMGINLVLAYCGAPVCARYMRCSLMNIYTSMQIADNLEENVSTFYAELKRIKTIIDAVSAGEQVVYLLDEIFKGTNSKDRIFGAKTILRKLYKLSTLGLITTHDLELGALERECPSLIKNYHFSDHIKDNQITFDYQIKPGISQSTNALALMKLIGIDMGENIDKP